MNEPVTRSDDLRTTWTLPQQTKSPQSTYSWNCKPIPIRTKFCTLISDTTVKRRRKSFCLKHSNKSEEYDRILQKYQLSRLDQFPKDSRRYNSFPPLGLLKATHLRLFIKENIRHICRTCIWQPRVVIEFVHLSFLFISMFTSSLNRTGFSSLSGTRLPPWMIVHWRMLARLFTTSDKSLPPPLYPVRDFQSDDAESSSSLPFLPWPLFLLLLLLAYHVLFSTSQSASWIVLPDFSMDQIVH